MLGMMICSSLWIEFPFVINECHLLIQKEKKREKKIFPRSFSRALSCVKHHTWTILTPCCQQSPVQARASEPSVMSAHGPRVASCQKRIRAHATRALATRPLTTRWSSQFYHQSDHRIYGMIIFFKIKLLAKKRARVHFWIL